MSEESARSDRWPPTLVHPAFGTSSTR
jgi:hypothetical protein